VIDYEINALGNGKMALISVIQQQGYSILQRNRKVGHNQVNELINEYRSVLSAG
jgi:hypothetical protein